ncbi:circularly permuted type 2 ATP-grasp protein [Herbaspirillum sp. LeCh32-8]|uniref:circularly permuted type 2 ATP-grasp protein n=1 Tax=Herbaspirillum sp. LeCh32-8 TaxID=2821356 RepID=UPI001AE1EFC8|nr:circularly permuted type 2 ATP-grasp protein [Herbaspirillum sp. LeCh32-8]MBP0600302.1 circularly permuted type 2 ATP-grasp protein [Herbaspirillum sp. LeCh32-8]
MHQRLLESYPVSSDRYDEMLLADGRLRPHWRTLIDQLENLSPEMLRRRANEVRDAIASDGVTYNVYADPKGANRPWELDLLPHLVSSEEWGFLSRAVDQRARLMNAVLADIYGEQSLIAGGLLPPALLFGQHGYLMPCHGLKPPGGVHLHAYAIDLARSADGTWWVVSDRTQGPSGTGYALQNRQIMSRAMPEALRDMQVESPHGYFHTLRSTLTRLAPANGEPPLIVLLTPGPYNETYSEHAFLAHTLGFPLVEGVDLTVRGEQVFLKTLNGLRRVHAILRRMDDDYCDPLELRADSALGVPGLTQAARLGNVLVANSLGSGVLESTALHGFLPAINERLFGEPLMLPAVASWWCGEKPALDYTLEHFDDLVIVPAFSSMRMQPVFGHTVTGAARRRLIESLQLQPHAYAAQEWVRLSQAPVMSRSGDYRLMNRTISLRVFAVADGEGGYHVMPGGLTRVASRQRRDVVSMQQGGTTKDVWVLREGDAGAAAADQLPDDAAGIAAGDGTLIRSTVDVSSHAGENLFWMGRYSERVKNLARLLRTTLQYTMDGQTESRGMLGSVSWICSQLGVQMPKSDPRPTITGLQQSLQAAVVDTSASVSVATQLRQLAGAAYQVREHLSLDNWHALNKMPAMVQERINTPAAAQQVLGNVIDACSGLAGHALDDMTRDAGWQFLMVGRHIERMVNMATLFDSFLRLPPRHQTAALSWLLESASSIVTYRVRYRRTPEWLPVLHLLVFDVSNPHGMAYQFRMLQQYLAEIAQQLGLLSMTIPTHLAQQLEAMSLADFAYGSATAGEANARLAQLMRDAVSGGYMLSDDLSRHYFTPLTAPVSQGV